MHVVRAVANATDYLIVEKLLQGPGKAFHNKGEIKFFIFNEKKLTTKSIKTKQWNSKVVAKFICSQ